MRCNARSAGYNLRMISGRRGFFTPLFLRANKTSKIAPLLAKLPLITRLVRQYNHIGRYAHGMVFKCDTRRS